MIIDWPFPSAIAPITALVGFIAMLVVQGHLTHKTALALAKAHQEAAPTKQQPELTNEAIENQLTLDGDRLQLLGSLIALLPSMLIVLPISRGLLLIPVAVYGIAPIVAYVLTGRLAARRNSRIVRASAKSRFMRLLRRVPLTILSCTTLLLLVASVVVSIALDAQAMDPKAPYEREMLVDRATGWTAT